MYLRTETIAEKRLTIKRVKHFSPTIEQENYGRILCREEKIFRIIYLMINLSFKVFEEKYRNNALSLEEEG